MKIIFDMKCGFEECYVVEKGIEYDFDLLLEEDLYKPFFEEIGLPAPVIPPEEEIYKTYGLNAGEFLRDFNFLDILEDLMKEAVATTFLKSVCFQNDNKNIIVDAENALGDEEWFEPTICELTNIVFDEVIKKESDIIC